jgi:hypothetical protein
LVLFLSLFSFPFLIYISNPYISSFPQKNSKQNPCVIYCLLLLDAIWYH